MNRIKQRGLWSAIATCVLLATSSLLAEIPAPPSTFSPSNSTENLYQIGNEWGKTRVFKNELREGTVKHRAALATGYFRSSTAFFLGFFNGHAVMATNYHVCPSRNDCLRKTNGELERVKFPFLGKNFQVGYFLGSWPSVDFALFTLNLRSRRHKEILAEVGQNLAFNEAPYLGQKLLTVGFGGHKNRRRYMTANEDKDCVVFSKEVKFYEGPNQQSGTSRKVWSFANGCDASHGDSGSPLIDRKTGDIVGLVWTGGFPKSEELKDPQYLKKLFEDQSEKIWRQLSYGVPATKIAERLKDEIENEEVHLEVRRILKEILGRSE